jgi:LmbE family N-acetylglucosaminyl deacetylase
MTTPTEELNKRIGHFLTQRDVQHLQDLLATFSLSQHVEVVDLGVGVGTSTLSLLAARDSNIHITSIDINAEQIENTRLDIERCGCADKWMGIVGTSAEIPEQCQDRQIDFLLIDSVHTEEHTRAEAEAWLPLVRPGGIVWFHDWKDTTDTDPDNDFPGIRKVVGEALSKGLLIKVSEGEYGWAGRVPMSRVLIISPHPDDEAIGCGGAIFLHYKEEAEVQVLHLTSGEQGCNDMEMEAARELRETEAGVASQVLGTKALYFWREPDGKLTVTRELVDKLARLLDEVRPDRIYTPHLFDSHPDHRAATKLVQQAVAQLDWTPQCYMYEIWTPLLSIDLMADISAWAAVKRGAIRAHKSQWQNAFEDAILALNHYRGILHGPNIMFAEAFQELP